MFVLLILSILFTKRDHACQENKNKKHEDSTLNKNIPLLLKIICTQDRASINLPKKFSLPLYLPNHTSMHLADVKDLNVIIPQCC